MASHFQRVDSDDDDDDAPLDLSAWKSGSGAGAGGLRAQRPPAPVASMVPTMDDDGSEDELATSALNAFQSRQKPERTTPPRPASGGFTSINRSTPSPTRASPSAQLDGASDEDDGLIMPDFDTGMAEDEEEERSEEDEPERPTLAPILPVVDYDEEDVVDMTAGDDVVRRVLAEVDRQDGAIAYSVELGDYSVEEIPFETLLGYTNGQEALDAFTTDGPPTPPSESGRPAKKAKMTSSRPIRKSAQRAGFVSSVDAIPVSDDELSQDDFGTEYKNGRKRKQIHTQYTDEPEPEDDDEIGDEEDSEDEGRMRRRAPRLRLRNQTAAAGRSLRSRRSASRPSVTMEVDDDEDDLSSESAFLQSDLPGVRQRESKVRAGKNMQTDYEEGGISFQKNNRQRMGERQSGRSTRHQGGMREVDVNDIYRSDSDQKNRAPVKMKVSGAKEAFKPLPRNDEFRMRHSQECEVCGQGPNFAQLIYCQGCMLAYHKSCLGHRGAREHLVTKIGEGDFVLQCRRCVAYPKRKDSAAPDQGKCSECYQHGNSCKAFRSRLTPSQEQKERDENDGEDPAYEIHESRINNADNVLFRCVTCWRGFHFEHLPSRSDMMDIETDVDVEQRFREYSRDWKCKDCLNAPAKVSGIIAWKPVDEDNYDPALAFDMIDEDEKAYLVRWDGMSYFRATWMPGAWVWGTTAHMMRKAFAKREEAQHPKMRTEDAIPEDYLRTDIVLDIKFTSIVDIRTEEVDKARIREIDKALIKYKGLGYEDAVWEAPPSPEDGDRWTDFVTAYNDWVLGRYVRQPTTGKLKKTLERVRTQDFSTLEKKVQPETVQGGELMKYQIEGLNWLYYKWFTQNNAILADEMGLGKTIQIIGFLATLVQDHNCFPFLVVVPNSTCPNWRREIKRWAPALRVVAYYGSKESRDLAYRYELFPEGSKDLRCHVVVTSYDAAADENCRKFFRSVSWQGLIVDEGQRLKNDKNLLYSALGALRSPLRILLTGTPLQNNTRELFNLLHFLDESYQAAELEERFADLDQDKITELHDMIRPFFLRRTKAQVLTFLPPMAQIIVPVSMSIVQKKLYRTILAKNPDLMRAIFSSDGGGLKQGERASLNNILMQLRKCLCHPFVYNKSIEERNVSISASHRNLVDASSKLKLLELLLPKLRERGHRVLIFSQFLDMLDIVEDFMDGMAMPYQRLDGSIGALQKQKRIDEFNAPDSPLFAFLLSTRAGGVGINLASADTVIILDPDFNPHQDIQALSRAHRIGQRKKVLCFQLVTRASAEERIMQMGRKKLALDHVLIQEMDAEDGDENDLVSVLKHGAGELFQDSGEQDIAYDPVGVERLLDRSHMENTTGGEDKSAEMQFSYARVWANNAGALQDEMHAGSDGGMQAELTAPDPGVWANILKERERIAAEDAAAKAEAFGRGRRARGQVNYDDKTGMAGEEGTDPSPLKPSKRVKTGDESDTDFQAEDSGGDDDQYGGEDEPLDGEDLQTLGVAKRETGRKKNGKTSSHLSTPNTAQKKKSGPALPAPSISPAKHGSAKKATSTLKPFATPTKRRAKAEMATAKGAEATPAPQTSASGKTFFKLAAPQSSPTPVEKPKLGSAKGNDMASALPMKKLPFKLDATGGGEASLTPMNKPAFKLQGSVAKGSNTPFAKTQIKNTSYVDLTVSEDTPATYYPTFRRAIVPQPRALTHGLPTPPDTAGQSGTANGTAPSAAPVTNGINCLACRTFHAVGSCPLKIAGVEHCNLCGIAHFGHARVCPHIQSETQVRAMIEALRHSNEPEHLVNEAKRYLRGLKGSLVQIKKQKEAKVHAIRQQEAKAAFSAARAPIWRNQAGMPSYADDWN